MKRLRLCLAVLVLLIGLGGWTGSTYAQAGSDFNPNAELISPEGSPSSGPKDNGESALVDSEIEGGTVDGDAIDAGEVKSGGVGSWLADHGLGLVKGIGAGLIGAGIVALGALVVGASAPLLLIGGAAVLGGAIYGLITGSREFNWAEAIVGSVIGGISAGVGSWLTATGSAIAAKVGVAVTNLVAGGLTGLASYLIRSPNPTLGGAVGAFTFGSALSGVFMAAGAVAGRVWTWGKAFVGLGKESPGEANSVVQAALAESEPSSTRLKPQAGEAVSEAAPRPFPTRGNELRAKYGHLTREERLGRIDQLAGDNYERYLQRLLADRQYVYRYTTFDRAAQYLEAGRIARSAFITDRHSVSRAEIMLGAQILPEWGSPEVGLRIPVSALRNPVVPRPFGGMSNVGWELYTNSYPDAGPGHWLQFLAETETFDESWVFHLDP